MGALNQNKFLTDSELKQFMDKRKAEKGTRNGIIMGLLFYTAARQCELASIKKEHIYNGGVYIIGKKNSNDGLAMIPPEFYKELLAYVKDMADNDTLFPLNTSTLRRIWYKFTPNHKKSLHCLRHTYAVRFYNNCENIHSTKNALRHKNINNTMIYLDYVDNMKKQKQNIKGMWNKKMDNVA